MSYILDGLKKAEKERQLESVPDLQTNHHPLPGNTGPGRRKSRLLMTGLFLLLAGAGGAALTLHFPNTFSTGIGKQASSLPSAQDTPRQTIVLTASPENRGVTTLSGEANPAGLKAPLENRISAAEPQESSHAVSGKNIPGASPDAGSTALVPYLVDMREDFRSSVPEIRFAGHTYAETPQDRLIIINNKIMKEGQLVEGELFLREITWEGIILEYRGIAFRMTAVQH